MTMFTHFTDALSGRHYVLLGEEREDMVHAVLYQATDDLEMKQVGEIQAPTWEACVGWASAMFSLIRTWPIYEWAIPHFWDKENLENCLGRPISNDEWQSFIAWVNEGSGYIDAGDAILQEAASSWEETMQERNR